MPIARKKDLKPENCGCRNIADIERLMQQGFKPRLISLRPGSIWRKYGRDRIVHCWIKHDSTCPESRPYRLYCEIESNPIKHPLEHMLGNGYKELGACKEVSS